MILSGAQPVATLLEEIEGQLIEADARFQIMQANAWSELVGSRPLLEGYDRQANLGLLQLSVRVSLVMVPLGPLRRLWCWIRRRPPEPSYRLLADGDPKSTLQLDVVFARDPRGRWRPSEPSMADAGPAHPGA